MMCGCSTTGGPTAEFVAGAGVDNHIPDRRRGRKVLCTFE
jgi:hypothetical protein